MMDTIKAATLALWNSDPSITKEQKKAALDALSGRTAAGLAVDTPTDRLLTRRQVAEILAVKPATVTVLTRKGLIRAVYFGEKGKLASGYSAESVRALLERRKAVA